MESIIERLKKVKALAENGIGGETSAAKVLLKQLMIKYKISPEMISDDIRNTFEVRYRGEKEQRLISQIMRFVTNNDREVYYNPKRKILIVDVTAVEAALLDQMIDFHKKQFKKEKKKAEESLFIAYIHKHQIFPEVSSESKNDQNDDKQDIDILQIMSMIDRMENATFRKAIA